MIARNARLMPLQARFARLPRYFCVWSFGSFANFLTDIFNEPPLSSQTSWHAVPLTRSAFPGTQHTAQEIRVRRSPSFSPAACVADSECHLGARHPAGTNPVTSNAIHTPSGPAHARAIAKPITKQTTRAVHQKGLCIVYVVNTLTPTTEFGGK
jgi:hypothetical protein